MKVLLDTCTALWLALDAPELSTTARSLFQAPENEVYLSSVSDWEIALKYAIGKLPLPRIPEEILPELREKLQIESLPLEEEATLYLPRLPDIHSDPFDRMLLCQAIVHGLTLLTPDTDIRKYPVRTAW